MFFLIFLVSLFTLVNVNNDEMQYVLNSGLIHRHFKDIFFDGSFLYDKCCHLRDYLPDESF